MTNRGILFVAFHFPPSAAVGGQRAANFARQLLALGWKPHVLTIDEKDIEQIDRDRLRGLEGVIVHKAGVLPTLLALGTSALARMRRAPAARAERNQSSEQAHTAPAVARESMSRRLRRSILSFLALPDFNRGWIPPATLSAIRLIRRHRIEWMMTSCPPYSTHIVGLAVKRATGVKWVADFRDPWMTTGSKRLFPTSALSLKIESWLERRVVERSDLLVFNVQRLRDAYRARYSHVAPGKFVFIPNAVMPPAGQASLPKYDTFTVSYTGSLYVGRSPEPLFDALSRLVKDGRVARDKIRIKLVGQCRNINGTPTAVLAGRYGLDSIVDVNDTVPVTEASDIVQRSHLALLLAPGLPFQIPAKAYDYLGVGTRILAIAEEGGTADLVNETGCGQAFSPSDVDGIARFLDAEIAKGPANGGRPASLARFDARRITEELVSHLDRISSPVGARP
jgi:Glycosyl transferase 4-like domain